MFSSYVFKTGGGSITIKKVKSSNKKIVDAAGGFIIAKKPGTAKVSALVNGKRRTITVIVGKKSAPKPTLKQLQVKVTGYKYYPTSGVRWNFQEMIAKAGYSCKEDLIAAALESKLIVTTLK